MPAVTHALTVNLVALFARLYPRNNAQIALLASLQYQSRSAPDSPILIRFENLVELGRGKGLASPVEFIQ